MSHNVCRSCRKVREVVTHSSLKRELYGLNLGPVKSDTVLLSAHKHVNISSKEDVMPARNNTEIDR